MKSIFYSKSYRYIGPRKLNASNWSNNYLGKVTGISPASNNYIFDMNHFSINLLQRKEYTSKGAWSLNLPSVRIYTEFETLWMNIISKKLNPLGEGFRMWNQLSLRIQHFTEEHTLLRTSWAHYKLVLWRSNRNSLVQVLLPLNHVTNWTNNHLQQNKNLWNMNQLQIKK